MRARADTRPADNCLEPVYLVSTIFLPFSLSPSRSLTLQPRVLLPSAPCPLSASAASAPAPPHPRGPSRCPSRWPRSRPRTSTRRRPPRWRRLRAKPVVRCVCSPTAQNMCLPYVGVFFAFDFFACFVTHSFCMRLINSPIVFFVVFIFVFSSSLISVLSQYLHISLSLCLSLTFLTLHPTLSPSYPRPT